MIKTYLKYRFGWMSVLRWRKIATVAAYLLALYGSILLVIGIMGALFAPVMTSLKLCSTGLMLWLPLLMVDFLVFMKRNSNTVDNGL